MMTSTVVLMEAMSLFLLSFYCISQLVFSAQLSTPTPPSSVSSHFSPAVTADTSFGKQPSFFGQDENEVFTPKSVSQLYLDNDALKRINGEDMLLDRRKNNIEGSKDAHQDSAIQTLDFKDEITLTSSTTLSVLASAIHLQSQQSDADALCVFKCGITNWPGYLSGWGCTCPAGIATNAPCGSGSLTATAWTGVTCSGGGTSGYVSELDLGYDLTGTISSSLSAVIGLTYLSLTGNSLTSSIPSQLSALTGLTRMELSYNNLNGSIPSEISSLTGLS